MPTLLDARKHLTDHGEGRDLYTNSRTGDPYFLAWHHATGAGLPAGTDEATELRYILGIERYHIDQGYGVFGYHGMAFASGRAYITGSLTGVRSHVASRNYEGHGFCFAGTIGDDVPTQRQMDAARLLRAWYVATRGEPRKEGGHTDFALAQYPTSCPGATRSLWLPLLRDGATAPPQPPPQQEEADAMLFIRETGHAGVYRHDPGIGLWPINFAELKTIVGGIETPLAEDKRPAPHIIREISRDEFISIANKYGKRPEALRTTSARSIEPRNEARA